MLQEKQGNFRNLHQILIKVIEIFLNFTQKLFYWNSNVKKIVFLEIIKVRTIRKSPIIKKRMKISLFLPICSFKISLFLNEIRDKNVLIFVLALILYDSYSFKIQKTEITENSYFLKKLTILKYV